MSRFFVKNRFFVAFRANLDNIKYPNAPTMMQQDADIAKNAVAHGGVVVKDFLNIDEITLVELLCNSINYTKEHNGVLTFSFSDNIINNYDHLKNLVNSGVDFLFCDKPHITNELLVGLLAEARNKLEIKKNNTPEPFKKRFDLNRKLRKELREYELSGDIKAIRSTKRKISALKFGRKGYYTSEGRMKGGQTRRLMAQQDESNKKAFEIIDRMMKEAAPLHVIAETLNIAGYKSSRGCKYYPCSVRNLANLYRPKRLDKKAAVIKAGINERLYNELLNDEEAYKDIHAII